MEGFWIQAYVYSALALILGLIFYIINSSIKKQKGKRNKGKNTFLKELEKELKEINKDKDNK